jgi:oxygen-independent coproporphyrinogen III oxidase
VNPRHVYIHVPFCARRCAYCDFAIAVRKHVPVEEYVAGTASELELRFPTSQPWVADTLYFGGGTPSRLGGAGIARLLERVRDRVTLAPGAEVTLEANPEDIDLESVRQWRDAGVNRLSIGSQSFDDDVLRWMHRTHDSSAIRRAVEAARAGGIDNYSLDLIFALPPELDRSWERDVSEALALEPSHLSLYGLTVEPATPLARWRERGSASDAPEESYEREFLHAHDALSAAGLEHYEVSNFGHPGRRARHNSAYWTGASYAGLGPSAHEFDGVTRRWNVAPYSEWQRRVAAGQDPLDGQERLDEANRAAEQVYLGLRTDSGLRLCGTEFSRVQPWIEAGWGNLTGDGRLVLTPLGWLRLDTLAADLTATRSR